jgi:hypothetical protein
MVTKEQNNYVYEVDQTFSTSSDSIRIVVECRHSVTTGNDTNNVRVLKNVWEKRLAFNDCITQIVSLSPLAFNLILKNNPTLNDTNEIERRIEEVLKIIM